MVDVADAAAASATNGDADRPGWSATSNAANPAVSARAANDLHDAASANDACSANSIFVFGGSVLTYGSCS